MSICQQTYCTGKRLPGTKHMPQRRHAHCVQTNLLSSAVLLGVLIQLNQHNLQQTPFVNGLLLKGYEQLLSYLL